MTRTPIIKKSVLQHSKLGPEILKNEELLRQMLSRQYQKEGNGGNSSQVVTSVQVVANNTSTPYMIQGGGNTRKHKTGRAALNSSESFG